MMALALPLALTLAGTGRAHAQVVHGELVDSGTARPVSAALVEVLSDADSVIARAISDSAGRFSASTGSPGIYHLRVRHIGFRSLQTTARSLGAGEAVEWRVIVNALPTQLAAVEVEGATACPATGPLDQATSDVWSNAVSALLLAVVYREQPGMFVRVRITTRDVSASSGRALSRSEAVREEVASEVFRGPDPDSLARFGYIRTAADGTSYYAPDAAVLSSDSFARTHCFTLVPDRRHKHDGIGLSFTPTPGDSLAGVRGVLWLDRRTSELRSMEFTFTKLPENASSTVSLGGRIDFEHLASGMWLVRHWEFRMPLALARHRAMVNGTADSTAKYYYTVSVFREESVDLLAP